jgi:hypothetical protein
MIVCSYSSPKNVLDKSAEDIFPGGVVETVRTVKNVLDHWRIESIVL